LAVSNMVGPLGKHWGSSSVDHGDRCWHRSAAQIALKRSKTRVAAFAWPTLADGPR
jgi:hypothetical protein